MIATLNKLGEEGMYLNIKKKKKAMCGMPTANIVLRGEKLKVFPQDQEQENNAHPYHF